MKKELRMKKECVKQKLKAKRLRAGSARPVPDFFEGPKHKRVRGNRKISRGQTESSVPSTPSTLCISQVPGWLMRVVLYAGDDAFPVACTHRLAAWSILRDSRQVSSELRALSWLGQAGQEVWDAADERLLDQMQRVVRVLSALTPLEGPQQMPQSGTRKRLRLDYAPLDTRRITKRIKQEVLPRNADCYL